MNRDELASLFSAGRRDLIEASKENTREIVNRHDLNTDNIITNINEGFDGLKSAFEWQFSEIAWLLEQQTEELKKISAILKRPRATQADELKHEQKKLIKINGLLKQLTILRKLKFSIHMTSQYT